MLHNVGRARNENNENFRCVSNLHSNSERSEARISFRTTDGRQLIEMIFCELVCVLEGGLSEGLCLVYWAATQGVGCWGCPSTDHITSRDVRAVGRGRLIDCGTMREGRAVGMSLDLVIR